MLTVDPKSWLGSRGIEMGEAQKVAKQIKQHYPKLIEALKAHSDVRGELELVELVFHVKTGRFPPTREDSLISV
jgi:hypothetical protein